VDSNRAYAQVLAETNHGSLEAVYHYGDDLISQRRDSATRYFHTDGLGSTRVLTGESGSATDVFTYGAFGQHIDHAGTTQCDYRYTGEQFDNVLDKYYLRARYYDPKTGRFDQLDPWLGDSRNPVTLNKYVYANSDPAYFVDPSGNFGIGLVMMGIQFSIGVGAGINMSPHEAAYWYRTGDGKALKVPLSSIDFQGVFGLPRADANGNFQIRLDGAHWSSFSDAAVYGTLTLKRVAGENFEHLSGGNFGFEYRKDRSLHGKLLTIYGFLSLYKGESFEIDLKGTVKLP